MTFGERLKELRMKSGYTQKQIAEVLKVGRPTIAGYETKNIYPDYEKLIALADFFKCSTDYLLGRTDVFQRFSISQLLLTQEILDLVKKESYINHGKNITGDEAGMICEDLKTAFMTIKVLKRI